MENSSEGIARCSTTREIVDYIEGVPCNETVFGDVTGVPKPSKDTYFIVSAIVDETVRLLQGCE